MKLQNIIKRDAFSLGAKKGLAVGALAAALPLLALAQVGTGINQPVSPVQVNIGIQGLINILNTVVSWIFTVFLIVAVIFIIIAAFRYLFSGGDPAGVKSATKAVVFAAVAIAVALLSVSVRFIVQSILGIS